MVWMDTLFGILEKSVTTLNKIFGGENYAVSQKAEQAMGASEMRAAITCCAAPSQEMRPGLQLAGP